ncbi:MAG: hypothetical protein ACPK85_01265 [Methanosarcina sp.]
MVALNDKISLLKERKEIFQKLPVIRNYYLIIGGGKIGTSFLHHARKSRFPFVLVIDKDQNAPASKSANVLKTETELINLLQTKAKEFPQTENKPEIYFYKMGVRSLPFLFSLGVPEFIIPAVPCHVAAYILSDLLIFPFEKIAENPRNNLDSSNSLLSSLLNSPLNHSLNQPLVSELFIKPEHFEPSPYSELITFFENVAGELPENIIAGRYPEQGILFLSYARAGEICPDGCPGPRTHCPTFDRKKPETVTEYVRKLRKTLPGWVFESYQMKPGIGGLKGEDFKENCLEIFEFLKSNLEIQNVKELNRSEQFEKKIFFVATTCTCHGVLNLFYVI